MPWTARVGWVLTNVMFLDNIFCQQIKSKIKRKWKLCSCFLTHKSYTWQVWIVWLYQATTYEQLISLPASNFHNRFIFFLWDWFPDSKVWNDEIISELVNMNRKTKQFQTCMLVHYQKGRQPNCQLTKVLQNQCHFSLSKSLKK